MTIDHAPALLRAILEDPDDNGVRLVYCDYLEENGQNSYAEFIRAQLHLATMADPWCKAESRDSNCAELGLPRGDWCDWCCSYERVREIWGSWPDDPSNVRTAFHRAMPPIHGQDWCILPESLGAPSVPGAVVRRGFVEAVTLSCAAFVGGDECPECRGYGRHADCSEAECQCGTGRTPGHAAALFASHSITRVTPSDKRPLANRPLASEGLRSFRWWRQRFPEVACETWELPDDLFNHLPYVKADYIRDNWMEWSMEADALADLSRAAVALGRSRAGLPPLPVGR